MSTDLVQASEQTETIETTATPANEIAILKNRARMMGITFSNNIGVEALRAKIQAKMDETDVPTDETDGDADGDEPEAKPDAPPKKETTQQLRDRLTREAMKLVRLRITNLDPKKKDLPGEIITVANEFIGTVRKYIPFGEVTDDGYHVPYVLYQELENRRFLDVRVTRRNGREHVEQRWAKEFALEVLPQLTPQELARLSAAQAAAGGLSD